MPSLRGQLLIASPVLDDPHFSRSVVVIAEHDYEGALGLVLNRPSEALVAEMVPALTDVVDSLDTLYIGGPVEPDAVLLLAEFETPASVPIALTPSIGLVTDTTEIGDLATSAIRQRAFAGCAGWGPGQLEAELERDDWFVETALPGDIFCEQPESLWSDVLMRMGDPYRLIARMPLNPSLN